MTQIYSCDAIPPVLQRMTRLIEERALIEGWLAHYEQYFTVHDRNYLLVTAAPGAEYLWALRSCGSVLVRIDVDESEREWARAAVHSDQTLALYSIRIDGCLDGKLNRITPEMAQARLGAKTWELGSGTAPGTGIVYAPSSAVPVAYLDATSVRYGPTIEVDLVFCTPRAADRALLTGLWILARCQMIRTSGTLFVRPGEVSLNGHRLYDWLLRQLRLRDRNLQTGECPILPLHAQAARQ